MLINRSHKLQIRTSVKLKQHLCIAVLILSSSFSSTFGINRPQSFTDSLTKEINSGKEDTLVLSAINNLINEFQSKGEYGKAQEYIAKGKLITDKFISSKNNSYGSKRETGRLYVNIGNQAYSLGNYSQAMQFQFEALKIFEDIEYEKGVASCYNNIGTIYLFQNKYEEALKYTNEALKLYLKMGEKRMIAVCYSNMAAVYINTDKYEDALKQLYASLKLREETGDKYGMSVVYNNIGDSYLKLKNYAAAMENNMAALKLREELNDKRGMAMSYNNIGTLYFKTGKYPESLQWLTMALNLAIETNYREQLKDIYSSLAELHESLRDYKRALEYHKLYTLVKDTLINEENNRQMADMNSKYETERKDKEIQLNKAIIEKQNINRNYLVAGFILFVLFSSILFYFYNQKRKTAFMRRVSEIEMKALRAQMNPHFTFNVLSSIQYYIGKNNIESAQRYLTKFSRLIRMILDQSHVAYITLDQEIRMLRLYLELEEMRFENKFRYALKTDGLLNPLSILMPGMLIQPVVENAIKHGIEHKKGEASIEIYFTTQNNMLLCTVKDNGIGRAEAEKLKEGRENHQPFATANIKDRFNDMSMIYGMKLTCTTQDLFDSSGRSMGTLVTMQIPLKVISS